MAMTNEEIIKKGKVQFATKLSVLTIGIGPVGTLRDLPGVVRHDDNNEVIIATKEAPEGCRYDQDRIAVVRIIGGKVKMNDMYDIYAPAKNKIDKLLSNPFDLNTLTKEQLEDLKPILSIASEVVPSLAPEESGRSIIVITPEMCGDEGYVNCHCPWDPEDVLTKMYPGDIFLIENEEEYKGYRIGKDEFNSTHVIDF